MHSHSPTGGREQTTYHSVVNPRQHARATNALPTTAHTRTVYQCNLKQPTQLHNNVFTTYPVWFYSRMEYGIPHHTCFLVPCCRLVVHSANIRSELSVSRHAISTQPLYENESLLILCGSHYIPRTHCVP